MAAAVAFVSLMKGVSSLLLPFAAVLLGLHKCRGGGEGKIMEGDKTQTKDCFDDDDPTRGLVR